ncbi:vault protein inter-alpha-trypsin [Colletotrichum cereale]|nr:vault protein inter-alpha-trypsin [Colletotrichum cereale]
MSLFSGGNRGARYPEHICGFYYLDPSSQNRSQASRKYLPPLSQSVHARIIASTSRTTLTQTFVNSSSSESIPELRYNFPLYDGVSVVAFTCTINKDRVIKGVVQEKNTARKTYDDAVAKGQTAGLFEQLPDASDVFTTTVGNVPAGAHIAVEIEYLGELKHDAEVDGIRFTIPTSIAPRFGSYPGTLLDKPSNVSTEEGISIVVDAEVPAGSVIKSIQSPSHPIAVSVGSTSTMKADEAPSLQLASATLSLGTAHLDNDFIIQVIATNTSNPVAVLETHPTIPHQQALMATLVPKFKMAPTKPEIIFICDRSGSMEGSKIDDLKNALKVFLKSLPVGAMFNICSFGSRYSFLFDKSMTYDQESLETAMKHVDAFNANYGGTEIHNPIQKAFELRHTDLDLEVFVITDGEVWNEGRLFSMVNDHVQKSKGGIRLFTLGVGRDVSHSLIGGLARAGNGFSQAVSENEKMSSKVVRMLKGALTPHVNDYTLELKYADAELETEPEDDFEIIEPDTAALPKSLHQDAPDHTGEPISLFDSSVDDDIDAKAEQPHADGTGTERYSHTPAVKPPKVLQAPFQIPPLFPFNRTTVYLFLSPDRELKDKKPESLILRGTSSQGPLELQVPITVLQDKVETIHQLAARKAVKELEEGRGWIFHAKDKDGQPLKDKHPGRFSSMVEREAVRLGTQFQVGGKWCSFVAVDSHPSPAGSAEDEWCVFTEQTSSAHGPHKKKVGMGPAARRVASHASLSRSVVPPAPASSLFTAARSSMPSSNLGRRPLPSIGSFSAYAPQFRFGGQSSRSGGGLFSAGAPAPPPPHPQSFSNCSVVERTEGGGLPVAHSPSSVSPAAQVDSGLMEQYQKQMDGAACMNLIDLEDDLMHSIGESPFMCDMSESPSVAAKEVVAKSANPSQSAAEKFTALVSLQEFSGYWAWSDELFAILGVSPQDVKSTAEKTVQGSQGSAASSTAAVVAFLRKKLAGERESWEMMEEKAVAWLEAELGDEAEKVLAALECLF